MIRRRGRRGGRTGRLADLPTSRIDERVRVECQLGVPRMIRVSSRATIREAMIWPQLVNWPIRSAGGDVVTCRS